MNGYIYVQILGVPPMPPLAALALAIPRPLTRAFCTHAIPCTLTRALSQSSATRWFLRGANGLNMGCSHAMHTRIHCTRIQYCTFIQWFIVCVFVYLYVFFITTFGLHLRIHPRIHPRLTHGYPHAIAKPHPIEIYNDKPRVSPSEKTVANLKMFRI